MSADDQRFEKAYEIEEGAHPLAKELQVGEWLGERGYKVVFRKTHGSEGRRTSDLMVDGVPWEIKQPIGSGKCNISNQFNEAKTQCDRLILDISKSPFDVGRIEREAHWQLSKHETFAEIILIKEGFFRKIAR